MIITNVCRLVNVINREGGYGFADVCLSNLLTEEPRVGFHGLRCRLGLASDVSLTHNLTLPETLRTSEDFGDLENQGKNPIGAVVIGIGFWVPLYYNYNTTTTWYLFWPLYCPILP